MLYRLCLYCFFVHKHLSKLIHMKERVHSMKTYILVEELPNGELVEAPLVLLKAQYNIYVVMGLLYYTGVQKIESVGHAVTLSAKPFKGVTQ